MNPEPVVSARKIQKSFHTGKVKIDVLKNISVDLYSGELTLILGPSGSGKSTFLATLGGLLKPDAGRVTVGKHNINELTSSQIEAIRLKKFGFVFQGFNLFSSLTALEQVSLVLGYGGFNAAEVKHRSKKALEQVGMFDKAHLKPLALSGGEKQRIAIARALAKSPDILFADEPTSNLDTKNSFKIVELLKDLANHNNTAVVVVSHDTRLTHYAERIITVEDGQISVDSRK